MLCIVVDNCVPVLCFAGVKPGEFVYQQICRAPNDVPKNVDNNNDNHHNILLYIPVGLAALVICISSAICWRSDIGALLAPRPLDEPLLAVTEVPRGRDEAGIVEPWLLLPLPLLLLLPLLPPLGVRPPPALPD